jgi:peptidoglycan/LPS O-acetylase OafA/YrhL
MRFKSLDSLRGLAALAVVLHHCLLTLPASVRGHGTLAWWLTATPLRLLVDGPGAVLLFFVLSGFVLAASIQSSLGKDAGGFDYGRFAAKRFLRIYPPFAFAVLVSAGLYLLIQPGPVAGLSVWFNTQSWAYPVAPAMLAGHFLMTDQHRDMTLINVMWSLIHELRISMIFPLIFFGMRARPVLTLSLAAGLSAAANLALSQGGLSPLVQTLCGTAQYGVMFAAGTWLYLNNQIISAWMARTGPWASVAAVVLGGALFFLPRTLPVLSLWATGLAAMLYVIAAFGSVRLVKLLSSAVLTWLGRVSFSLYLLHLPVLLTVFHLFSGQAPLAVLVAATVGISLLAAQLSYRWIEQPSMALGRWVTGDRTAKTA